MRKIIYLSAIIILLCSCSREYSCSNDSLKLNFIGYAGADMDTIIIRRYTAGTHFGQLVDTVLFTIDTTGTAHSGDTTNLKGGPASNLIQYGNDWQILLPSISKTVASAIL